MYAKTLASDKVILAFRKAFPVNSDNCVPQFLTFLNMSVKGEGRQRN